MLYDENGMVAQGNDFPEVVLHLNSLDRATLLALVGLAVSVMKSDEENGRSFIATLSQDGIEPIVKSLFERLNTELA